ncbi:unnamed protein product, partial [Chrysoparadoxa australica]
SQKGVKATCVSGVLSGVVVAGVFTPWDRALYLCVINKRHFLHKSNWVSPYQGFFQTISSRTIQGGLWWPLEDQSVRFTTRLLPDHPAGGRMLGGLLAGVFNALLLNPASAIKYHIWGTKRQLFHAAQKMYRKGGLGSFFKGAQSTVFRDSVFGAVFTTLRHAGSRGDSSFGVDFASSAVATVLSSPMNYARNIEYSLPAHSRENGWSICKKLLSKVSYQTLGLWIACRFVLTRLRIGWGTLRVAVGMACGSKVYGRCLASIEHVSREVPEKES